MGPCCVGAAAGSGATLFAPRRETSAALRVRGVAAGCPAALRLAGQPRSESFGELRLGPVAAVIDAVCGAEHKGFRDGKLVDAGDLEYAFGGHHQVVVRLPEDEVGCGIASDAQQLRAGG